MLERRHGSIWEMEKIMRGMKVEDTPIVPMNEIYYNFVRPHQSLGGSTPAEAVGTELKTVGLDIKKIIIQAAIATFRARSAFLISLSPDSETGL